MISTKALSGISKSSHPDKPSFSVAFAECYSHDLYNGAELDFDNLDSLQQSSIKPIGFTFFDSSIFLQAKGGACLLPLDDLHHFLTLQVLRCLML